LGSADFIKKKFGTGYHLIIGPLSDKQEDINIFESFKGQVESKILKIIPKAKNESAQKDKVKYLLPFDDLPLFSSLFGEIEQLEFYNKIRVCNQFPCPLDN